MFGNKGRQRLNEILGLLPEQTRYTLKAMLHHLDEVERHIGMIEKRMKQLFKPSEEIGLLMTMPGVGFILAVVISLEVGDVRRFRGPDRLASCSGTVPRVQ